jgi:hypothetical protein
MLRRAGPLCRVCQAPMTLRDISKIAAQYGGFCAAIEGGASRRN